MLLNKLYQEDQLLGNLCSICMMQCHHTHKQTSSSSLNTFDLSMMTAQSLKGFDAWESLAI